MALTRPRARDGSATRRGDRGQGLLEFALALPVMLIVLLSIFDLGRAVYAFSTITDAARTGSRLAIVNQDVNAIKDAAVQQALGLGTKPADVDVTFKNSYDLGTCATPRVIDCVAEVTVHYTYRSVTPLIANIVGTLDMQSTTRLPIEALCSGATCPPQYQP